MICVEGEKRGAALWRSATVALKPSLLVIRRMMDFFQHRYYLTTKILMLIIGQWPYLTIRTRRGFFALALFLNGGQIATLTMAFLKYHEDWDMLLDCILTSSIGIFYLTKLTTSLYNSRIMLKLLNRIRTDWMVWAGEREVDILHEYAEQGRKYVNAIAVAVYSGLFIYLTHPIVPKIIDVMLNNDSEPGQFPIPVYIYHLDVQKYYFYIVAYIYVATFVLLTAALSYDAMLIGYVQHCCGVFTALGHKLENMDKNDKSEETGDTLNFSMQRNRTFQYQIFTYIARHNDAIEYANLIEMTYSWASLITMLLRLGITSIAGLQIFTRMNEPQETVRFVACAVCMTSYVYLESHFAQVLRDHSISIFYYLQNSQWYSMSLKTQKLLMMMMMRCNVPCQLTAGKIVNISVESFIMFLKTAMSYFTLLRSI